MDAFLNERMLVLTDFMEDLGYEEPHLVLLQAERFIPSLSDYLKDQIIDKEDKIIKLILSNALICKIYILNFNFVDFFSCSYNYAKKLLHYRKKNKVFY